MKRFRRSEIVILQGYEVLIIDDDRDFLNLVRLILQAAGASVTQATSIQEGVVALQKQLPHLILLDLGLPDIPGLTFMEAIKKLDAVRSIPLMVVSAKNDLTTVTQALQLGANDYLTKPITRFSLLRKVEKLLKVYHDKPLTYFFAEPITSRISLPATLIKLSDKDAMVECAAKLTGATSIELKSRVLEGEGIEKAVCRINQRPSHLIEENLFTSTLRFFGLNDSGVKKLKELLGTWK